VFAAHEAAAYEAVADDARRAAALFAAGLAVFHRASDASQYKCLGGSTGVDFHCVGCAVMLQRTLGNTGISVGAIAFGCWRFGGVDVAAARERIETAIEVGMTLIDTADVYGLDNDCPWGAAEELLGQVFAEAPQLRSQVVVATKGGIHLGPTHQGRDGLGIPYESSPEWIRHACEQSLRRLQIDVIDLYQIHRPDLLAHPAEVAAGLQGLIDAGLVRHVGVSNYSASQFAALQAHLGSTGTRLVSTQPEFSLAQLGPIDDGVLDQAMQLGVTPLAWSPLGGGRVVTEPSAGLAVVLDELAAAHGCTRTAIALAFVLAHPAGVIPIVGTGKPERIREAATAADVQLNKAECYRLIAAAGRYLP
jgi:aryl-alcohol dehydrogenase-like predicted oxidoreductase